MSLEPEITELWERTQSADVDPTEMARAEDLSVLCEFLDALE